MRGSEQERYVNVEVEVEVEDSERRSERIKNLNDALRCSGIGGHVMMTSGIRSLRCP